MLKSGERDAFKVITVSKIKYSSSRKEEKRKEGKRKEEKMHCVIGLAVKMTEVQIRIEQRFVLDWYS